MKNRTLRRAAETLVLLLIAAMALLLAAGLHQHEPDGSLTTLSTGWYQLTDGVRRDVTLPATLPAQPGQTLTLYNDTLTDSDGGKVLSARGVEYDIEIRAGETLLYRYEDNAFPKNAQMKGRLWADAELPDSIGEQTLSLTLTPLSGRAVALAAPVLGTAPAVTGHHIQSSLFSIGMILAMLVLAVLALLIFFYMSFFGIRELRFLDVAVFLLLCSLWCLTDSALYQIYGRDGAAGSVISFYAFMTMAIPMVHFVRNTVSGRLRLVPDVCIALFCANALAQGAAYRLLGVPFIAMLPLTHLLLTAGVAAMLTVLLRSYRDKPAPQLRLRIAAFAALGAFGVAALVLYGLLHIAGAAVFVAVHRASVSRRTLTELLAVFALAALGIAAQAVNPSVLTTGFGLSLSILAMYLTINNPCACMDSLTGLNDKQYLLRRMDELTDAHKAFHIITVYAYQLDHMNKVAGVQNGDEFLRRAAERMQEIADRNVFRISGKRFLLMTFSLREYETCLTRLRQLFHTQPDDAHAAPTPVILCGVVNAEKLGTSGLVLDYAEYLESLVSRSGETQVIQNDRKTMDSFHYNKQVEQFLHRAIAEDLFEVYYQPVYSLHQQRFVTLEALSRLRHPELGWISPDIFIRLAEKNHLITQITELQLRRVCRFLCENPALRASIANVKINLSPLDLIQSESGSHLVRILGEYGLPCSCFQFEITETVATEYSASLTRVAESLQAAGIGLCLDDFGSGYANLNTVMQLPFSVIKLDRSLLFHICTDKKAALFYQSIVAAFCRLGYRIVAEGVETQEEMELLRSWNVDMIQGYYFSRPLPPDDLLRLLTESAETPAQDQA